MSAHGHVTTDELRFRILARLLKAQGALTFADLASLGSPFAIKNMEAHGLIKVSITIGLKGVDLHAKGVTLRKKRERRQQEAKIGEAA